MNKSQKLILYFITLALFTINLFMTLIELPLQVIIIFSNVEIIFLLFISYKYLFRGFLIASIFNIFNGIHLYLKYMLDKDLILFQMAFFHFIAIALSSVIYFLANKQQKYVKAIEANSYLDGVTEVFNHRYFQERLDTEFSKAKRMSSVLGVIFLNIDNFKRYNDTYGHRLGDVFLAETAEVLVDAVRSQDIVCRYGGDTFAIILPQLGNEEIDYIANNILLNYQNFIKNKMPAQELGISISLGYSVYPHIATIKDELISQADTALYRAKQQGRSNIKVYRDVFNEIKLNLNQTESQLFISLKTLLGTISAKDRYTLGHSERVMEYALSIGKEMRLTDEELKILSIAALLHDIGKIEIPQDVLNKKEKLTNEEFELIKKHPIYSAEIIQPLANLGKLYPIVLYHHERYDGRGYPKGLKGEDIPLEARILSVADSFDAMLSDRPYRKSLSKEKAIEELKLGCNTQFDSRIVESFLKILLKSEGKN